MKKIITEKNFNKIKELVKKNEGNEIVFSSQDDELNRKVLEKLPINILLISLSGRKDFSKQRNSGLNGVLSRIARKKGVKIGIDADEITSSSQKERVLSRIRQNIELCKKNRLNMVFMSKKSMDTNLFKSLGAVLGMPTWMVKFS